MSNSNTYVVLLIGTNLGREHKKLGENFKPRKAGPYNEENPGG
jgi:hypothetical protein